MAGEQKKNVMGIPQNRKIHEDTRIPKGKHLGEGEGGGGLLWFSLVKIHFWITTLIPTSVPQTCTFS